MSEQAEDHLANQRRLIEQEQAAMQFERWVNESAQIDHAYASGSLHDWLAQKLEREQEAFNKLSGQQNGSSTRPTTE